MTNSRLNLRNWVLSFFLACTTSVAVSAAPSTTPLEEMSTVPALLGTEWEIPGHFGFLHIDARSVNGSDGCNRFTSFSGLGRESHFIFASDGKIYIGQNWILASTKMACFPEREPAIPLPAPTWESYELDAQNLVIKTNDGSSIIFNRK